MAEQNNKNKNLLAVAEWSAPSNIALIKYWGKKENQIPENPSLSLTLSNSLTRTSVKAYKGLKKKGLSWEFIFEGKNAPLFEEKLLLFFSRIKTEVEMDPDMFLEINSENTFPHSAGIASSASSMAALSLCIISIEEQLRKITYTQDEFLRKASRVSRLGSGSACRSIYGGYSLWGKADTVRFSSDKYAIPVSNVHPIFHNLRDTILIVDSGKKEVSSSNGHQLMNNHPFAKERFLQARHNLKQLLKSMNEGNWGDFARIVENEALSLHSMMLTSNPWFILMKPASIEIINKIKEFRAKTGVNIAFTLDAGPNIHLLYPSDHSAHVSEFVRNNLTKYCENAGIIEDKMGLGPVKY